MKHVVLLMVGVFLSVSVFADTVYYPSAYKRGGNWETTLQLRWQGSEDLQGPFNTDVEIDNGWGFGFGVAYNFDAHWSLGVEFSGVNADYKATWLEDAPGAKPQSLSHEMDHFSFQANAVYHFLEGNFTPFVQGSIGWSEVDSNVISGYGYLTCWWDPWWGYVCGSSYDTYEEDGLTWGIGTGLRWDYVSNAFARLSVNQQWLDIGSGSDDPSFLITKLEFGWKF